MIGSPSRWRVSAQIAALSGLAAVLAACDSGADQVPFEDEGARRPLAMGNTPEALMVRFKEVRGTGSSTESWEIEVLQLATDVRVRGSIRTGGSSIPILHVMEPEEYVEFWEWLKRFPVDRARFTPDETQAEADWRKSLDVDIVLDADTRWVSRNRWTGPLLDAAWVNDVESRLHAMALDLAHSELDRIESEPEPASSEQIREAVETSLKVLDNEPDPNPAETSP